MVSMDLKDDLIKEFTDYRALSGEIFISLERWRSLMPAHGLEIEHVTPGDEHAVTTMNQQVVVAQAKRDLQRVTSEDIIRACRDRLPEYMVPAQAHILDAFPTTPNGKIDRQALERSAVGSGSRSARGGHPDEKMSPAEQKVATLFAEMTGCLGPSRQDDFFDLGGDSLLAARLVTRLRQDGLVSQSLTWDSAMRRMLEDPTIRGVARLIGHRAELPQTTADTSPLVMLNESDSAKAHIVVHDGSGTLYPYRDLIARLRGREHRRLVGLQLEDLDTYISSPADGLIERICEDHMGSLAPLGLTEASVSGYCMGGVLAVELARRLPWIGVQVDSINVVSSYVLPCPVTSALVSEYAFARAMGIDPVDLGFPDGRTMGEAIQQARSLTGEEVCDDALETAWNEDTRFDALRRLHEDGEELRALRMNEAIGDRYDVSFLNRTLRVFRQSMSVMAGASVRRIGCDINFFRQNGERAFLPSLVDDMTEFWRERCDGEFTVEDIPGDHFDCIESDNAAVVADLLLTRETR